MVDLLSGVRPPPPVSTGSDDASFEIVVIGAGSGGLTAAVGLARFGKRVLLVERSRVGGDCTNVGCIPSKSLLHLSSLAPEDRPPDVLAHVRSRRDHLSREETVVFGSTPNLELRFGAARLLGDGGLAIESTIDGEAVEVVHAEHIVIATGARPRRPNLGIDPERIVTNEELFEMEAPPQRLGIVGAGAIGLEMALAFARLGSQVTVFELGEQVAPGVFAEAAEIVQRSLEAQGVRFVLGVSASADHPAIADADRVLVAVGRQPNSEGLGLAEAGVDTDAQGRVRIDARGRTSVAGVWATGDVADRVGTTHGAGAWGRRIIKSIVAPMLPIGAAPFEPKVIFTDPELATIGEQPAEVPGDVRRIRFDLIESDRGFTDELEAGVMIVDVRRLTGTVLGATIVGPRAAELISVFALAMRAGVPMHRWYGTVWPYPSHADAIGRVVDLYMSETMTSVPSDAGRWLAGRARSLKGRLG